MKSCALLLILTACNPHKVESLVLAQSALQTGEPMRQPAAAVDLDPDPNVLRIELRAQVLPPGHISGFRYAYNGQVPGPTINLVLGQTLEVELINELDDGTTIHWHGLNIPNAMDGVPWQRGPIAAGGRFTYRFTVNQAGTFWYHPHFNTEGQVDGGLYGALIVRDPADEAASHDLVALIDNRAEARADVEQAAGPAHGHARLKRHWLVNGHSAARLDLASGSTIRLRMINVSNHGYVKLNSDSARFIGSDQGPFLVARGVNETVLAPGDRAEFEFNLGADNQSLNNLPYTLYGGDALGDPEPLIELVASGNANAPPPLALHAEARQQHADPGYADIIWTFAGSDRSAKWFINGKLFSEVEPETVSLGSVVILEVRNLSPTEHPFHLHGHHFEVLSRNGVAPLHVETEDTINVRIRERVRLRLVANNPGDWMSHCHILPHAEDGMMTVLRVLP
jgi:FtsP/CotA-like multicopper oxidase with cupredoxin domain